MGLLPVQRAHVLGSPSDVSCLTVTMLLSSMDSEDGSDLGLGAFMCLWHAPKEVPVKFVFICLLSHILARVISLN